MNWRDGVSRLLARIFAAELVRLSYRGLLAREPDADGLDVYASKLRESGEFADLLGQLCESEERWLKTFSARAPELIRALHLGLLSREPDPEALRDQVPRLGAPHDLAALLSEMARSDEHWNRTLIGRAPELVRVVYQGLLNREPGTGDLRRHSEQLAETYDLEPVLEQMARSDEQWQRTLEMRANDLVRALYRGLLQREPEADALQAYAARLIQTHDLVPLLSEIVRSDERWHKSLEVRAPDLVQALYRGLLQRDAEPEALEAYAAKLMQTHDLTPLLAGISRSDERWQRALEARAPELVSALYRGLLQRAPESKALDDCVAKLHATHDLTPLLASLARSDELWGQLFSARAPELVETIYKSLLERDPDASGFQYYTGVIVESNGVSKVLTRIITSPEFNKLQQRVAVVFLHIQKTAGTSMQGMLKEAFGANAYVEHADSLATYERKDLSAFSVFAGHFNHDSLVHIPCRRLSTYTFVREPKERLTSLYYFWRAHEPTAPTWSEGMKIANELLIEEFFGRDESTTNSLLWNHMTWAIMGHQQWATWRLTLKGATESEALELLSGQIRPAIRKRLREFVFVGLQEDYERSVVMLCEVLGWPRFKSVRSDQSLDRLTKKNPHFKKTLEKQPRSEHLDTLLDRFVQLDNIVYEESKLLYVEQVALYGDGAMSRLGAHLRGGDAGFSTTDLDERKVVFLHVPRTGGTALRSLLLPHFAKDSVCPERFNDLRHYACGELVRYRLFSGHFDLPSIKLIPGRRIVVTLLREPVARLVSLYHFLRTPGSGAAERQNRELARLASACSLVEFFKTEEVRSHHRINNSMTRVLTQVVDGRKRETSAVAAVAAGDAVPDVAQALRELNALDAFGIMERYEESTRLILSAIGLPTPQETEESQAQGVLAARERANRRIEHEPLPVDIRDVVGELVVADLQLYQHATRIFENRLQSRSAPVPKRRRGSPSRRMAFKASRET